LKADSRFAERQSRKDNRLALKRELEAALRTRPAKEWEQLFNERGVPAGSVLSVPEILGEAQVEGRKFVEQLDAEVSGGQAMRVTRPGFLLEGDYPEPAPPPVLGQDTRKWLSVIGYPAEEIAALGAQGIVAFANRPTVAETKKSWDALSHGERLELMKKVVAPRLGADFQAFDAKKYEKFSCVTCHGERIKQGDAKMPNPDLPHLSYTDKFKKHMTEKPAITKFMMEKVETEMADALGEKPFDPATKTGFGCGNCHIVGP